MQIFSQTQDFQSNILTLEILEQIMQMSSEMEAREKQKGIFGKLF